MQIVIPSRKRVASCAHALRLFPDATVCVDEAERDDYAPICEEAGVDLLLHPPDVVGIAPLRQWIMDHVGDESVVMCDDDIKEVRAVAGRKTRAASIRDPDAIRQILRNAEACARALGTPIFGFSQNGGDVRKFRPQAPFSLATWVGGLIGVVGRELRYDTSLLLRADIDFCLQALLKYRVIFMDNRFAFVHARFDNVGGNAHLRSAERNRTELAYLKQKWGKWLKFQQGKYVLRLTISGVRRHQRIKL